MLHFLSWGWIALAMAKVRHSILKSESLPEFFRDKVNQSIQNLSLSVSNDAEFYLVNLLTVFTKTEYLYERDKKGEIVEKALALQLFDSLLAPLDSRITILKHLGDIALYTSGFFGESLVQKMVSLDYYVSMGYSAYSSLSQLIAENSGKSLKELFEELSLNFVNFVDVLSDVADSTNFKTDQALIKLYDRWLNTGSERARKLLAQEGIIPSETIRTKYKQ